MSVIHKFNDKAYKELFSHPKMIQDLMEGFVGEEFVKDINLTELEKVNVTFIAESYKEREEDLIVKLKFKEQEVYLYILISFQSTPDKFMALRSLTYMLLFYQDLVKQDKIKDKLPMVFPITLYTGREKYTSPVKIEDLIYAPYENLMKYVPKYEYYKIEVKPEDKEEYKELAKTDNIVAACFDLVTAKNRQEFIEIVNDLLKMIKNREELAFIISIWLGHLFNKEGIDISEIAKGGIEMLETLFDNLVQEGVEKGVEKGREERNIEIATQLINKGFSVKEVSEITGLPEEEIEKLKSS